MNYFVLLVQRGISGQTHPVSGKSGKLYGTAIQTPGYGGVVLKLPLEVYAAAADDLIGSTVPMQQWVPHFVSDGVTQQPNGNGAVVQDRGVCGSPAGCRLGPGGSAAEADYQWQHYLFCAGHAPSNAKPLWAGAPPIYNGNAIMPVGASEDRGVGTPITEKAATGVSTFVPPEVMAAPTVGGTMENAPVGGVERPVAMPAYGGPRRADFQDPALGGQPPPPASNEAAAQPITQSPAPKGPSAAEVIQTSVVAAIAAAMPSVVTELKGHIENVVAAAIIPKAAVPAAKKKRAGKSPDAPPTLFEISRKQAAALGMNTFAKGKAEMDQYIAEHSGFVEQPESAAAAT